MKKFLKKIKPVLLTIFWMSCCASLMVLLGTSIVKQTHSNFQAIKINVDQSEGVAFIDQDDVLKILRDNQINLEKAKPVSEVDFKKLESTIEGNPFIEDAQVYVDATGAIAINIKQRIPLLRIINSSGVGYYVDVHSKKMPCSSKFTARIPVATGAIFSDAGGDNKNDSVTDQKLFTLADYIYHDAFLTALTDQIVVTDDREFEIIPRIANHVILLGDVDQLDEKFNKLKIFYRQGWKNASATDYKMINLKYENEVYCVKRNGNATTTHVAQMPIHVDSTATAMNISDHQNNSHH